MIVSWDWLRQYVRLEGVSPEELAQRLAMAGLNHESTTAVDDDLAIDFEVTSNRPDCQSHLGVAREAAVLFRQPLTIPAPAPQAVVVKPVGAKPVGDELRVRIDCPELCPRYTARRIRGVKIGPSPAWLARRLRTTGTAVVNNVVDVTNYVLLECGQPLHAFDASRLAAANGVREIVVRRGGDRESFAAIDHQTYTLDPSMCVIADARRAVALGGVMGGVDSEVSGGTTDLVIEAAEFTPASIHRTSRLLRLRSESSFRFERGVDPEMLDWASLRCCELVLELAGGELLGGVVDVGRRPEPTPRVTLRLAQLPRVLGIEISAREVRRILEALGFAPDSDGGSATEIHVVTPSWRRRDCTREIDLVEEVARVHGYDAIPEDVPVPMSASRSTRGQRVAARAQTALVGAGFFEALTISVVPPEWNESFNPWGAKAPVTCQPAMLKGASQLRHSLIPSLLHARQRNDALANPDAELFEQAAIYIGRDEAPDERRMLGLVSRRSYRDLKGVVEQLVERITHGGVTVRCEPGAPPELLAPGRSARLLLGDQPWGYLGEVSEEGLKRFKLRQGATVAEFDWDQLVALANLAPQERQLSKFPSMDQDLNFVLPLRLAWSELERAVRGAAGELLETLEYRETYRDPERDGPSTQRVLFRIVLRSHEGTLTGGQAEEVRARIVAAVDALGGRLL